MKPSTVVVAAFVFWLGMGAAAATSGGASAHGGTSGGPGESASPMQTSSGPAPVSLLANRPRVDGALTLERATEIALRESPVARGAVEEVEAAVGRLQAARAQSRPSLSTTSFATGGSEGSIYTTTDPVRPTNLFAVPPGGFFDQNLTLMVPVYTGGRLQALTRQAAAARRSALADLHGVWQEVALMTRTAYREVLARRAAIEVAQAVVKESEERLRVDRDRLETGAIPPFYLQRDEAELANARQQLTNAQRDADLSLLQLKTVIGVHPDSRPEPVGALAFEPLSAVLQRLSGTAPPPPRSPSGIETSPSTPTAAPEAPTAPPSVDIERYRASLLALAERQRPELQAARLRVEEAGHGVRIARSADRPQVAVGAMADWMTGVNVDSFGGTSFGLTASLPVFDAGLRRANRRTAEADQRRRQLDLERTALEVAQQVSSALLSLGAAEQNVTTALAGVRAAQAEYQVALERYQAGRAVLVEVLDALAARTRAETNQVQALFDYNVAQDQLRRAVGEPEAGGTTEGSSESSRGRERQGGR
jgi:outer membrane protein